MLKLNDRLNYINKKMREVSRGETDSCEISVLEKELSELIEINNWIKEEVKAINKISRDDKVWYFELKNNAKIDFKYFKVNVNVFYKGKLIDGFSSQINNFYAGAIAKMYFDIDVKEGSVMYIDADSVDYALMEKCH